MSSCCPADRSAWRMPVPVFVSLTVASEIGAAAASVTKPVTVPVVVCANTGKQANSAIASNRIGPPWFSYDTAHKSRPSDANMNTRREMDQRSSCQTRKAGMLNDALLKVFERCRV